MLAYDAANPHHPLAAVYPSGSRTQLGTPELDYPYVLLASSDQAQLGGGERVRPDAEAPVMRRACSGSRASGPTGRSPASRTSSRSSYGLDDQMLQVAPQVATSLEAPTVLQAWNKLSLYSKDLVEVDVSSNMCQVVRARRSQL